MKAKELKPGDEFKIGNWRKFRKVSRIIELKDHDHIEPIGRKVLIVVPDCGQYSLPIDIEVIIKN